MDYNFNLKPSSHRKFKMSSFLQPSGLERCFSTSSRVNVNPCMANKLKVNPFLNFFSGLHTQANSCKKSADTMSSGTFTSGGVAVSSLPSGPFAAGMSVSCIVGGFVGSDNPIKQTQEYCDNLFLDVLLNECLPFDSTTQPTSTQSTLGNTNAEPMHKRTYAEVTKEKPKPRKPFNCIRSNSSSAFLEGSVSMMNSIKRNSRSCDNFPILHQSHSVKFTKINSDVPDKVLNIQKVSSETLITPLFTRLKTCSSSSDSSSECDKNVCRTLSESSIESDDSFIVFQNDDGTVDDFSEEESSDEDDGVEENSDEVPASLSCSEKGSSFCEENMSARNIKKKVVRWAANLVKVHPLRMWDFASRAARPGPWEQLRRDRERFQRRIRELSSVICPVLDPTHRKAIYEARFEPS